MECSSVGKDMAPSDREMVYDLLKKLAQLETKLCILIDKMDSLIEEIKKSNDGERKTYRTIIKWLIVALVAMGLGAKVLSMVRFP